MMKRLLAGLLAAAAAATPGTALADGLMVVAMRDGSAQSFLLADRPQITYSGSTMTVTAPQMSADFEVADVADVHFTGINGGVDAPAVADGELRLSLLSPGVAVLTSPSPVGAVALYDLQGRRLSAAVAEAPDRLSVTIDISGLQPGVYIVAAPRRSFKIIK